MLIQFRSEEERAVWLRLVTELKYSSEVADCIIEDVRRRGGHLDALAAPPSVGWRVVLTHKPVPPHVVADVLEDAQRSLTRLRSEGALGVCHIEKTTDYGITWERVRDNGQPVGVESDVSNRLR